MLLQADQREGGREDIRPGREDVATGGVKHDAAAILSQFPPSTF